MRQARLRRIAAWLIMATMLALSGMPAVAANDVAALNGQVDKLYLQGKYKEAAVLAEKALALGERTLGREHPDTLTSIDRLGRIYTALGRYGEAEPLYLRALEVSERVLGREHPSTLGGVSNLAWLYGIQGRHTEAEQLYRRLLAIPPNASGRTSIAYAKNLNDLALLYNALGRYAEAEPLYRLSLATAEKALGPNHPNVGTTLGNLASLYKNQGRYAEAESLFKRSLAIREKALGPDHPQIGQSLNNLALLYHDQRRFAEAEPLFMRSLAIHEKVFGSNHPEVGTTLNNLATLYMLQRRYAESEPLHKRALAIREKVFGPDHPRVAQSFRNLAGIHRAWGNAAETETLLMRSLAISEKALGADHPDVGLTLEQLAALNFGQKNWLHAADYFELGVGVSIRRKRRETRILSRNLTGQRRSESAQTRFPFEGLVKANYRRATTERNVGTDLLPNTFIAAQWSAESEAAAALTQMSARLAKGDTELAKLVRERQDLADEWRNGINGVSMPFRNRRTSGIARRKPSIWHAFPQSINGSQRSTRHWRQSFQTMQLSPIQSRSPSHRLRSSSVRTKRWCCSSTRKNCIRRRTRPSSGW